MLQKRWQSLSLPLYYLLDKNGVVRYRGTDHGVAIREARSIVRATSTRTGLTPSPEKIAESVFDAHDADKNGRIVQSELPKEMRAMLAQADLDKDAALSMDEVIEFLTSSAVISDAVESTPASEEDDRTSDER